MSQFNNLPGWLSGLVQWGVREQEAAGAPVTSGCTLPVVGTASARSAAMPPSCGRTVAACTCRWENDDGRLM